LYSTRCSIQSLDCITAFVPTPEAIQANRGLLAGYIAFGGVAGVCIKFLLSLIYRRNRSMEQQLRRAIRKDRLRLVYQPIVDLASRRIVGAEALVRWTNEENLAVAPNVFVRLAEERHFVGAITELVLRHALRDFGAMLCSQPSFRLSVNLAAADLADPAFLPRLGALLERTGVSASSLALEITESSTARYRAAMETIVSLRQRGHSVHIDDFGTGYSSLSYLHDLSVDAIKIDQSFTRAIGTGAVILAILPPILTMTEALNLQVVVEGVETEQQADYFAGSHRPVLAQGWLFGRPVAAPEFHRLLAEDQRPAAVPAVAS
jgi:sensor c-di-GMP phosphodiesterase-like protein